MHLALKMSMTALACIQVRVGSLSDPLDTPGLAHFCEHMLFYASAKYPEEDAYSKFVVSSLFSWFPCISARCRTYASSYLHVHQADSSRVGYKSMLQLDIIAEQHL